MGDAGEDVADTPAFSRPTPMRGSTPSMAVEREIRPLALTRKNYLFAGSDTGGMRAGAMYTSFRG
jgi:hypothetical protein